MSGNVRRMMGTSQDPRLTMDERLKILYPMVNELETPLPRSWSTKDKYNFTGLSQNNLRVHYKGHGKNHKDASSVRATHSIPASCGIYYFEVKIVSKGRDGYMGVGLSAQGVNLNRLPGWDKNSYGYHGDDGHSFCSSGTGQSYGPTFTTGDVIGCGVNLIDGSCFYTKNGHHLGIAFTDIPSNMYPTVGLQTPGEVVDTNFGQEPFLFDIEGEVFEYRSRMHRIISDFPVPGRHGEWQQILQKMVSSYLVHHGYCATAESFVRGTGQQISEDLSSVKNRQAVRKLVLAGRLGEAIRLTDKLYPGLLESRPTLKFILKVRHFIEMVGGIDEESTSNGNNSASNGSTDDNNKMDVDPPPLASNPHRLERLIHFGRCLQTMLTELETTNGKNEENTKMLQDAFSLLAHVDPWGSPVGWQLDSSQRESICTTLNSAILESKSLPGKPPLEISLGHIKKLVKIMADNDLGTCAFADVDDFLK
uniref:Ran-binding protein 10 n=1 Tax=Lepeophtheirus salmonis TaxID=72036 RepID=C1BS95_LEPSM|nr:Ran-binding protein 10 [Lepeophtheirus salmonis]